MLYICASVVCTVCCFIVVCPRSDEALLLFVVFVVVCLRWDDTHVVAMDIDVNDQVQQQMVLQVYSVCDLITQTCLH